MSHFSVLVIGEDVDGQLAPYHEFECTGVDDEYVQDVDITEEVLKHMNKSKEEDKLMDALSWYGLEDKIIAMDELNTKQSLKPKPILEEKHKYGYAIFRDGKIVKAVKRTNPNKKWDWYVIGGRWRGFLVASEGSYGPPSRWEKDAKYEKNHFDRCLKKNLLIDIIRQEAYERAHKNVSELIAATNGLTPPEDWDLVIKKENLDIDKERELRRNSDFMKAIYNSPNRELFWLDSPEKIVRNPQAYIDLQIAKAFSTFAVVKDGKWYERGRMGWWANVSGEKSNDEWLNEFNKLIDSLPDDALLTIVDCHI